jgi:cell division protein FtsZ
MASPLLEAGAIDGARGILINITGSSSLKLSEVNAASSLIQSAAHEDANIIFGAVLDEKMGDEVKITVIATGFRDQMPERRARMLSVEEAPVVSVPVMAPDNWLEESAQAPEAQPVSPRFQSQEEESEEETVEADEPVFFSASAQAAASSDDEILVVEPEPEPELVGAAARPHFGELSEAPAYTPLPRDYAADLGAGVRSPDAPALDEQRSSGEEPLFPAANEESQRDLDVPAFMRRLQF